MKTVLKAALKTLLISLLYLQSVVAVGNTATAEIHEYMNLSGIDEMVGAMPGQINAMISQRLLTSENPQVEARVMQVLADAWDTQEISDVIADHIAQNSTEQEIAQLLSWRKSPLVLKMTAVEAEASLPDFQPNLVAYLTQLQTDPPTPETMQAVRRLVVATEMVEMMVDTTMHVVRGMTSAFMDAGSQIPGKAMAEMNAEIDSMQAMLTAQVEQQALLLSYYIYRDVSNSELDEYSSFYESALGKRELKVVSGSLNVGMSLWAQKSAADIVEYLQLAKQAP